jgi:ABC-type sugar transport system ATPase subunit
VYDDYQIPKDGVGLIGMKNSLIEVVSISENLFTPKHGKIFQIKKKSMERHTQTYLDKYGIGIAYDTPIKELSLLVRFQLELLREVIRGREVIILKGLGKLLTEQELLIFTDLVKRFERKGIAFVYIGSFPDDFFRHTQKCSLFENGQILRTFFHQTPTETDVLPYLFDEKMDRQQMKPVFADQIQAPETFLSSHLKAGRCLTVVDRNGETSDQILSLLTDGNPLTYFVRKDEWGRTVYIPDDPIQKTLFPTCSYLFNLCFFTEMRMNRKLISRKLLNSIRAEFYDKIGEVMDASSLGQLDSVDLLTLIYFRAIVSRAKLVVIHQPFMNSDSELQDHIGKLILELKKDQNHYS